MTNNPDGSVTIDNEERVPTTAFDIRCAKCGSAYVTWTDMDGAYAPLGGMMGGKLECAGCGFTLHMRQF